MSSICTARILDGCTWEKREIKRFVPWNSSCRRYESLFHTTANKQLAWFESVENTFGGKMS